MSRLLLEALSEQAASQPDQKVWTFLDDRGEINDSYAYKELDRASSSLAAYLVNSCKLKAGDRALLVFFPGLHFMASLIACFKAGIIAIPVFPPDPRRLQKDLHHFVSVQKNSGAAVAITHSLYNFAKKVSDIKGIFTTKEVKWPELRWIVVDDVLARGKEKAASSSSSIPLPLAPKESDVAFLQYTSGSTSEPKGVMISHGCLGHNLTLIIKELKADTSTINVSWLPQYHDMGLIGSYLGTLYCGGRGFFLSPISFLKDPNVWLRAVSKYQGTHTQAPNFAYALACRKFKGGIQDGTVRPSALASFNLKSVKHMINAAEPVDQVAISNFYSTFRPYGLSANVVVPTYGLAEHTVFVCSGGENILTLKKRAFDSQVVEIIRVSPLGGGDGKERDNSPDKISIDNNDSKSNADNNGNSDDAVDAAIGDGEVHENDKNNVNHRNERKEEKSEGDDSEQTIVGCGYPSRGDKVQLVIVDSDTHTALGEDKIGEIWVSSPSKALGYWALPDLTSQDFHAKLKAVSSTLDESLLQEDFLSTGDLGFLHAGELFICGRSKDLIIVRGSNHYPQDIERSAERNCTDLRAGCSAAFSVAHATGHTEAVVYVAEVLESVQNQPKVLEEIIRTCRRGIAAEHGLMISSVILLKTRTIPKTTSGKIARSWCRRGYLEGTLSVLLRWDAASGENGENGENEDGDGDEGGNIGRSDSVVGPVSGMSSGSEVGSRVGVAGFSNGGNKYAIIGEPVGEGAGGEGGSPGGGGGGGGVRAKKTVEEIRALSVSEIIQQLESTLKQIASQSPAPLTGSVGEKASLSSLGLDSFTIVQFKGVLEKRFYCDIPDEFLFSQTVNLTEVAKAVKIGCLSPSQQATLDAPSPHGQNHGPGSTVISQQKQPLCPWFTCCY